MSDSNSDRDLLDRLDNLEIRLLEVEALAMPMSITGLNARGRVTRGESPMKWIQWEWQQPEDNYWNYAMQLMHARVKLHEQGQFESTVTFKDHSGHRRYGNEWKWELYWELAEGTAVFSTLGVIGANFSPNEEKEYPLDGHSLAAQGHFTMIWQSRIWAGADWRAWPR